MKSFLPQSAKILDIQELNETTRMFTFDISVGAAPGQFVNLWIPDVDEKPFSVADDDEKNITLAIAKVGPFTEKLFEKKVGETLGIRGAYGNIFSIVQDKQVVLVGGGFGSAPLHFLGKALQRNGCDVTIIIGARNKNLLMYENECLEAGFRVFTTTDDGSHGEKGFVTTVLERLLTNETVNMVQTCGPEKMMEAVAKICKSNQVDCEVSLERYMKCGFGVCGQCACDQKLVCRDGCIFTGKEALQMEDFGKFHRGPEGQKEYWKGE